MDESLDLFRRMREGEFDEGAHVVRAKIDMAADNMKLRDPPIYRIKKAHHYRTGTDWVIYPLYDFTHCLSDSYEGITHSLCTLEFDNNRALYDWILANTTVDCRPEQTEFARLALSYTLMSKRKLLQLVKQGAVGGWDDPRMPTLAGFRRRGVSPEAIRAFCDMIGVAKANSLVDIGKLEYCIRDDLNQRAPRVMAVLQPLEVVISNFPEGEVEMLDAPSFPSDVGKEGSRQLPLSGVIYIERDDFMQDPPKGFHRLAPGREVRLRYAHHVLRCDEVVRDDRGEVVRLVCSYDADAKDRKVKGTIHWVSKAHAVTATVRLYDRLFSTERPEGIEDLNPSSLVELQGCMLEPSIASAEGGDRFQFERQGYFCIDSVESQPDALVINRTVSLRDSWAKVQARGKERTPQKRQKRDPRPSKDRASAPRAARELSPQQQEHMDRHVAKGVAAADAHRLASNPLLGTWFDAALTTHDAPQSVANWLLNEVSRHLKEQAELPFDGAALGELVALVDGGSIGQSAAKRVLAKMLDSGGRPQAIVDELGLAQLDESALGAIIDGVIASHPDEAARFRDGKSALMGFFVGQVMRATKGRADPKQANSLLRSKLSS